MENSKIDSKLKNIDVRYHFNRDNKFEIYRHRKHTS
jgi:hypothetical protein